MRSRGGLVLAARPALGLLAGAAALELIGLVFDARPLQLPALALMALAVWAPARALWSVRATRLTRRMSTREVVEGEPVTVTIELHRGRLAGGWARMALLDPLLAEPWPLRRPEAPAHARNAQLRFVTRFPRRGPVRLAPPGLLARDPLGLGRAERRGAGSPLEIVVLPRVEPVHWTREDPGGLPHDAVDRSGPGTETRSAGEVDGLRPYRTGTPASRVHWPALAGGRGLLERRLAPVGDGRPLVVLDVRGSTDPARVDAAVRAAASLTHGLARAGGCGLLLPGAQRPVAVDPGLAAWPALHARLAVSGTARDPAGRRPPAPRPPRHGGTVFHVAAGCPRELVAELAVRGGPGARTVLIAPRDAVRAALGAVPEVLTVADCVGVALGARVPVGGSRSR